ncbi:hypothetical protein [Filifactor alocis]|uniref:hypothetical protein n=1 Tax=Filifactor alocis TaxID=143361 RepID=UPI003FA1481D
MKHLKILILDKKYRGVDSVVNVFETHDMKNAVCHIETENVIRKLLSQYDVLRVTQKNIFDILDIKDYTYIIINLVPASQELYLDQIKESLIKNGLDLTDDEEILKAVNDEYQKVKQQEIKDEYSPLDDEAYLIEYTKETGYVNFLPLSIKYDYNGKFEETLPNYINTLKVLENVCSNEITVQGKTYPCSRFVYEYTLAQQSAIGIAIKNDNIEE